MKPTVEILTDILAEVRPLIGQGKVADYIPALAKVPSNKLGIAVYTNEGEVIKAGDADEPFSIQSISKALSLTLAMCLYKQEEIWSRVGKEPSGQAFNSLIQLEMEQGIPRNPFINAGTSQIPGLEDQYSRLINDPASVMNQIGGSYQQSPGFKFAMQQALQGAAPPCFLPQSGFCCFCS